MGTLLMLGLTIAVGVLAATVAIAMCFAYHVHRLLEDALDEIACLKADKDL